MDGTRIDHFWFSRVISLYLTYYARHTIIRRGVARRTAPFVLYRRVTEDIVLSKLIAWHFRAKKNSRSFRADDNEVK